MIKKIIKYSLVTLFCLIIGLFFYFKFGSSIFINKGNRDWLIKEIKASPQLPNRFYEIYETIYPNSLEQGQFGYLMDKKIFAASTESPAREAIYLTSFHLHDNVHLSTYAMHIEKYVTQKECLNYYVNHIQFSDSITGIQQVSKKYLNKELEELNDIAMAETVLISIHPHYYSKIQTQDIIEIKLQVQNILKQLKKQKKSRTLMQLFNVL